MENFHILKVNYLSPTNTKGARVSIKSERFEQSKIIPFDYTQNSVADMAINWLLDNGFTILGEGESKDGYYIISTTFEPLK